MLSVDIEKIVPVTEARDMFNKIIDEVEGSDELYVLTKNGKPAAVVVGINHLEKLTGENDTDVMAKVDQVGQNKGNVTDINTGDQFMAADTVAPKSDVTPAEEALASPADLTPASTADLTPASSDTALDQTPSSSPAVSPTDASTDPFMPEAPASDNQTNPPGSTGGYNQKPATTPPADNSTMPATDPLNPPPTPTTDNATDDAPIPQNPSV